MQKKKPVISKTGKETEIDKIRVITGNGIGIRFRSNINNAKVPMIVYLKRFIFIAILRGNLGRAYNRPVVTFAVFEIPG
jgi:hypothetical protein